MEGFRHILIATDFSDTAALAEDHALVLAARFGARLTLVHVYQQPLPYYPGFGVPMPDLSGAAAQALEAAFDRLKGRCTDCDRVLAIGSPWEQILLVAKERGADLIVMGTHGRRGLSRALLGSVAEKVVRLAPIPVLTVRGELAAAA